MLAPVPAKRTDGGSSFATLGRYMTEEINMQTGEVLSRGEVMISDALLSPETAAAEMKAVAAQNTRCKDSVMHIVLSWDSSEKPSVEQWKDAVNYVMDAVDMKEHQFMAVAHDDTDNYHVHIMANKVHPETYKSHTPAWLHKTLDKALREVENKHGWKTSNGLYRWDDERGLAVPTTREERQELKQGSEELGTGKAAKMELYSGVESLEAYCKKEPAKALNAIMKSTNANWSAVQNTLQEYGLQMHKADTGGYTVSAPGEDGNRVYVKASKVFRNQFAGKEQRAATDEKLGDWKESLTDKKQPQENKNELERIRGLRGHRGRNKPGIGGIGQKPPPQSKNHLRELSQLGVVRIDGGSEMLLQGDVSDNVEHQRTELNNGLRRDTPRRIEPRLRYDRKATGRTALVRAERGQRTAQRKADYKQYKAGFIEARKTTETTAKQDDKKRLSTITRVSAELRKEIRVIKSPEIKKAMLSAVTDAVKKERQQVRKDAQARRKAARLPNFREWMKSTVQVQQQKPNAREEAMKSVGEALLKDLDQRLEQHSVQHKPEIIAPVFDPAKIQAEWKAEQSRQFEKVQQKARKVKGKTAAAVDRQTMKQKLHGQNRPEQPKGLFSGFKQGDFQTASNVWQGLADSIAKRWVQLTQRDQRVNEYTERSNVPNWPSKGEILAERWAATANPSLAQAVEKIKQDVIDQRRKEMEQKLAAKNATKGMTKEQKKEAIKDQLKAENSKGHKL